MNPTASPGHDVSEPLGSGPPGSETQEGQTAPGWNKVLATVWIGWIVALVCVGVSSHIIGRPVFWLDDQRWSTAGAALMAVAIALPAMFTTLSSFLGGRWLFQLSLSTALVAILCTLVDRHDSPGSAVVTAALSGAALLLAAAARATQVRPVRS